MLEQYEIQQQVSSKAGRSTYIAKDFKTSDRVIIKFLEFNSLFDWDDLKLFEREAKTLKNLSHPNIPRYLDYCEIESADRQGFALVQTYIDAPSLAELIEKGIKFSEREIIELAQKLLEILNYLHQLNPPVIHRDIKPSNILLNNRSGNSIGDVYLVDFGSVQTIAKKEAGTITIVGSYGYIPLEQFMGQTTFASDLYSLGMTLVYLVTGIHPADLTHATGKVKFDRSSISREFALWLRKMTEPYLDKRYTSAATALTALHAEIDRERHSKMLSDPELQDIKLRLSSDRQNIEITYFHGFDSYIGCLPLLGIFFIVSIILTAGWSLVIIILLSIISHRKPKYRLISIDKHRQIRDGFYWQKQQNIEWQQSSPFIVNRLVYSPSYTFNKCLDVRGRLVTGAKIKVATKLTLITSRREFCISEKKSRKSVIADADLWWLGNEVADFLNLELEVIPETPVIPPQPSG